MTKTHTQHKYVKLIWSLDHLLVDEPHTPTSDWLMNRPHAVWIGSLPLHMIASQSHHGAWVEPPTRRPPAIPAGGLPGACLGVRGGDAGQRARDGGLPQQIPPGIQPGWQPLHRLQGKHREGPSNQGTMHGTITGNRPTTPSVSPAPWDRLLE